LAVFAVFVSAVSAWGEDRSPFLANKLAKEELALAKTPSLYFIVRMKSKKIALKSRGMSLGEWEIKSLHAWGDAPPLSTLALEKKSRLPERTKIQPASSEEDPATFELDALELKDMPAKFTLFLTGGTQVYIRPKAKGLFPLLGSLGHFLAWNIWVPLKNLSFKLRKKPFAAIAIKLETKEDGQAIFWALPDGIKGLVFPL
jgi:hypothetical protein